MGCTNSSAKTEEGTHNSKYHQFLSRVYAREPLAVALNDVYTKFLESCNAVAEGKGKSVTYPSQVQVLNKVSDANKAKLTYQEAKNTASDFLGYAMKCLQDKSWGGEIHTSLQGAEGRKAKLALSGEVEFDSIQRSIKRPFSSVLLFFLALE